MAVSFIPLQNFSNGQFCSVMRFQWQSVLLDYDKVSMRFDFQCQMVLFPYEISNTVIFCSFAILRDAIQCGQILLYGEFHQLKCTLLYLMNTVYIVGGFGYLGVGLSVDKQMIQHIAPGLSCPDKLLHYKVKMAPWEKVLRPSQTKHPLNPTISFSHHLIILRNMITLMFPKHSYLCDQQQIYGHFKTLKQHVVCKA